MVVVTCQGKIMLAMMVVITDNFSNDIIWVTDINQFYLQGFVPHHKQFRKVSYLNGLHSSCDVGDSMSSRRSAIWLISKQQHSQSPQSSLLLMSWEGCCESGIIGTDDNLKAFRNWKVSCGPIWRLLMILLVHIIS